jgi:Cu(I)/Ag(I) efflux system membrane fusion protein
MKSLKKAMAKTRDAVRRVPAPRIAAVLAVVAAAFWLGRLGAPDQPRPTAAHAGEHAHESDETIWTCSMHPQVQLEEPGQCPICFMDLVPVAESDGDHAHGDAPRLSMSEGARIRAGIRTAPARRLNVFSSVDLVGKIDYDETRIELITARVAGRIDRLYVDYTGVPVRRGDHLARIYSPELVTLQRELLEAHRYENDLARDASTLVRDGARRALEAAREKIRLLGFSNADIRAILERGDTRDHMTIRAGQRGVVIAKLVQEGAYVSTGAPLYRIADLSKVWVKLDAYESDLTWLRLGQRVHFEVEAWPGEHFEGVISFIDPAVDPATRTVKVRVIVENPDRRLKPDMFVRARVRAEVAESGGVKNAALEGKWVSPMHPQVVKDAPGACDICGMPLVKAEELGYAAAGGKGADPLVIPATAPLLTGKRAIVYVEVSGADVPTYEGREIVLGPRAGEFYVVVAGLAEGERVVVDGAFRIDGELQIRAKPSMMNPARRRDDSGAVHAHAMKDRRAGPAIARDSVPERFRTQLAPVYQRYFAAAEALAADSATAARRALDALAREADSVDAPPGKLYAAWRSAAGTIDSVHGALGAVDSIDALRGAFHEVSNQMIMLDKHYGQSAGQPHYLAYCPMAFENAGAYWLQTDRVINNPYFGARMRRCGEIRDTIP